MADSSSQVEDGGGGGENFSSPPPPEVLQSGSAPPKLSTTSVDELSSGLVDDASAMEPTIPYQALDEFTASHTPQECDNSSEMSSLPAEKLENLSKSPTSVTPGSNSNARSSEEPNKSYEEKILELGEADQVASVSVKTCENASTENSDDKTMSLIAGSGKSDCSGTETAGSTKISELKELGDVKVSAVPDNSSKKLVLSEPSVLPVTQLSFAKDSVNKEENLTHPSVNVHKEPLASMPSLPLLSAQPVISAVPTNSMDNDKSYENVPGGDVLSDMTSNAANCCSVSHESGECSDQRDSSTVSSTVIDKGEPVSSGQNNPRVQKNSGDGIAECSSVADAEINEGCPGTSHEADTESLPLAVNADLLCRETSPEDLSSAGGSEVNNAISSPTVLDSAQINASVHKLMPSLESEPLQPVTIGSSLQPLEEIQEQSLMEDPSFTPNLDLIEDSVDEPGSVGGLVINSVIGAADGIVDFQPDEEMETDRELVDISASAPALEGTGNNATGDGIEPSAKRMRFENGDLDNKSHVSRKVTIKVSPVKNGHGLWGSQKLLEILRAKGTVLLRIHASKDSMELFEPEKSEIDVDFTGVMLEAKDDETEQILGLSTTDTDPDAFDPLGVASSQVDHGSPPHYSRQHPLSRGRSTALQPATRPVFKHLQSPPHQYMKHEVLGLPHPLEYEEPQMGAADWSGVMPFKQPHFALPTIQGPILLIPRQPEQNVKPRNVQVQKVNKVCEECFAVFPNETSYLIHKKVHLVMQQCGICKFKTKDQEIFRLHILTHQEKQVELKCNVCKEVFTSPITYTVHRRKIHCLYECRHCLAEFNNRIEWTQHIDRHKNPVNKNVTTEPVVVVVGATPDSSKQKPSGPQKAVNESISKRMKAPVAKKKIARVRCPSKLLCYICYKKLRSKKQLRIHVAEHLGVPVTMINEENLYGNEQVWAEMGLASASYDKQNNSDETTVSSQASGLSLEHPKLGNANLDAQTVSSQTSEFSLRGIKLGNTCTNLTTQTFLDQGGEFSFGSLKFGNVNFTTQTYIEKQHTLSTESNNQSPVELSTAIVSRVQTSLPNLKEVNIKEEPVDHPSSIVEAILTPNPAPVGRIRKSSSRFRISKRLTCDSCPLTFKNMTALKIHEKQRHSAKLKCPACSLKNTSSRKIFHHQKMIHKEKLRCHYMCLALFDTREEQLAHHKLVHNKDNDLKCRYCGAKYARGMFSQHLKECKEDPIVRQTRACKRCGEEFVAAHEYFRHVEECVAEPGDAPPDKDIAKPARKKCTRKSQQQSRSKKNSDGPKTDGSVKQLNTEYSGKDKSALLAKTTVDSNLAELTQQTTDNHLDCDQQTVSEQSKLTHDLTSEQSTPFDLAISNPPESTRNVRDDCVSENKAECLPAVRHKCHFCPKSFKSPELGIHHIVKQHRSGLSFTSKAPKVCHICDKSFMSCGSAFCKHILKHYGDSKNWNALVPSNMEVGIARKKCWICNVSGSNYARYHLASRDRIIDSYFTGNLEQVTVEEEVFNCGICNESFPHRYAFWCHVKIHFCSPHFKNIKGGKHFSCVRCTMTYKGRSELLMHLGKHLVKQEVKVDKKIRSNSTKKKTDTDDQNDVENRENKKHSETLANATEESQERKESNDEMTFKGKDNKSKKSSEIIETKSADKEEIVIAFEDNKKEDDEVVLDNEKRLDKALGDKQGEMHETADGRVKLSESDKQGRDVVENAAEKQQEDKEKGAKSHPQFFRCEKCNKKFGSKPLAVHHAVTSHRIFLKKMMTSHASHACHLCNKTFLKPLVLCSHILKHYTDLGMWEDFVPRKLLNQSLDRKYCWICKNMLGSKAQKHLENRNDYIERVLSSRAGDLNVEEPIQCSLCDHKCSNIYAHWKHVFLHLYKNVGQYHCKDSRPTDVSHDENEEPKSQVFYCSKCSCEFKDESKVTEHIASHFLSRTVEAEFTLPSRRMLRRRTQSIDCSVIPQREERKDSPEIPEIKVEAVDSDIIIESFPNFEQPQGEESVKSDGSKVINKFWKCRRCDGMFDDVDIAVKHVLTLHKFKMTENFTDPMNCYLCGANFKRHTWMCRHIAKHFCDLGMWDNLVPRDLGNKINLRQCWICKLKLTNEYGSHTSKRNENIEKLLVSKCNEPIDYFSCSLCNTEFKYRHAFWVHMLRHLFDSSENLRPRDGLLDENADASSEEKKSYQCSDCSLSFPDEPHLYKHLALHLLENVEEKKKANSQSCNHEEIGSSESSDEVNSDEEWLPTPRKKLKLNETKFEENRDENKSMKREADRVQSVISDNKCMIEDEEDSDTETSGESEETDDDDQ